MESSKTEHVVPPDNYALACEVAAAVTSSLVLEDVLEAVARRIAEAMGVWECDLYEYRPEAGILVAAAVWARELMPRDEAWIGTVVDLAEHESYRRVVEERALSEGYADDDSLIGHEREQALAWGELATLAVPLVSQGAVVGCLTLIEKREARHFTDADRELVELLASPAAAAIRNARMYREQEEQTRQLASLLDSSRALTSTVVLEDVLHIVCRSAVEALGSSEAVIYEYDATSDELAYRACFERVPSDGQDDLGERFSVDEYPSGRAILTRGEVLTETVSDPELPADVRASLVEWGEKTCLSVPLLVGEERLGILVLVEKERERRFGDDETGLACGLGEQAAVALRRARLYRRQERQNKRLLALLETSRVLASSLDATRVLAEARREAAALFGIGEDAVAVWLRSPAGGFLPLEQALQALEHGLPPGHGPDAELDEVQRHAAEGRRPVRGGCDDGTRVVVPVVLDDVAEALAEVRSRGRSGFTDDEVTLLELLAGQAASAIVNARLYEAVERQAITDGLTGLYNHRHFYERLGQEHARARRYGLPLSLLMIDVDDFKAFNDCFGHQAGDQVLAQVGAVLTAQLRRNVDFAARYGGEEFAVLLPNTSRDGGRVVADRLVRELASVGPRDDVPPPRLDGARNVGERIRASIARTALEAGAGEHVTVSVGLAAFPGSAAAPDDLVRNADKALYLAKRLGKNRLQVFEDA